MTCDAPQIHFIFRHKNPVTREFEEKHLKTPPKPTIEKTTNLYTLILQYVISHMSNKIEAEIRYSPSNQTYEVLFNGESQSTGSLLEDFSPAVNPDAEIDDPEDFKPEDWVDTKRIADPEAKKPEDWDEDAPYEIPDMDAEMPEDWLVDEPSVIPDPGMFLLLSL